MHLYKEYPPLYGNLMSEEIEVPGVGQVRGEVKYDIVFFGEVMSHYADSSLNLLLRNYVFLFRTRLDLKNDGKEYYHGHVNVELVRSEILSFLHNELMENADIHVFKNEPLKVNEFIEIRSEGTEMDGLYVVADLKKQKIKDYAGKIYIDDFHILLYKMESFRFQNSPTIEYGKEFEAKVDYDKAFSRARDLLKARETLTYSFVLKENPNKLEEIRHFLDEEFKNAADEMRRLERIHSRIRKKLLYVTKDAGYGQL